MAWPRQVSLNRKCDQLTDDPGRIISLAVRANINELLWSVAFHPGPGLPNMPGVLAHGAGDYQKIIVSFVQGIDRLNQRGMGGTIWKRDRVFWRLGQLGLTHQHRHQARQGRGLEFRPQLFSAPISPFFRQGPEFRVLERVEACSPACWRLGPGMPSPQCVHRVTVRRPPVPEPKTGHAQYPPAT